MLCAGTKPQHGPWSQRDSVLWPAKYPRDLSLTWKNVMLGVKSLLTQTWTGAFHVPGVNLAHWASSCSMQGVSFPCETFLKLMAQPHTWMEESDRTSGFLKQPVILEVQPSVDVYYLFQRMMVCNSTHL